ncbi:MAG: replication-relaxation family protein [Patescibacteria group bacterium]
MDTPITPKQLEILTLIYRFRFLNRHQIQTLLNHKDPKRINTWLKDLTEKHIIGRKYSTKLKENTRPAIYHLATKSRKILLQQKNTHEKILQRAYRDKNASEKLIAHSVFVAAIYLQLTLQSRSNQQDLHFYTKTDLASHYYLPYNRPDAYIALKSQAQTKRYFLELIDEGTPRFMLRKKIAQYIDYFDENIWHQRTGYPNPALLIVCPDQRMYDFLLKHIKQVLEEETSDLQWFLGLKSHIEQEGITPKTWQQVTEEY